MDGGEKRKIPLSSGLEVRSGDMFCSADEPLFLHNRQKWQGKCLPSSLRYEHDGWAAGNGVYNFAFRENAVHAGGLQFTSLPFNETSRVIQAKRKIDEGVYTDEGSFWFNLEPSIVRYEGTSDTPTIERNNGVTELTVPVNGRNCVITYDNGVFSYDEAHFFMSCETGDDCITRFTVTDLDSRFSADIDSLFMPSSVFCSENEAMKFVSYSNGMHTWEGDGGTITYRENDNILEYNGVSVPFTVEGNKIDFSLSEEFIAEYVLGLTTDDRYVSFTNAMVVQGNEYAVAGYNVPWRFSQDRSTVISRKYSKRVEVTLPLWFGVTLIQGGPIKVWEQIEDKTSDYIITDSRPISTTGAATDGKVTVKARNTSNKWLGDALLTMQYSGGKWIYTFDKTPPNFDGFALVSGNTNNSMAGFVMRVNGTAIYDIKLRDVVPSSSDPSEYISITAVPVTRGIDVSGRIKPEVYQSTINSGWLTAKVALVAKNLDDYQVFSPDGIPGHIYTGDVDKKYGNDGGSRAYQFPVHYDIYTTQNPLGTLMSVNGTGKDAYVLTVVTATNVNITTGLLSDFDNNWIERANGMSGVVNPPHDNEDLEYDAIQEFRLHTSDFDVLFRYNLYEKSYTLVTDTVTFDNVPVNVVRGEDTVTFTASLDNDYNLHYVKSTDAEFPVVSADDKTVSFNDILYDYEKETVYYKNKIIEDALDISGDKVRISFVYVDKVFIDAVLYGIVRSDRNVTWHVDGDTLTINGIEIGLTELFKDTDSFVDYYYTDVHDEDLKEKKFATINASAEFQFLKQGWDTTVETENFWWIDNEHYLSLDKFYLVLHKNNGTLHDWNGNNFDEEKKWLRSDFIPSTVLKYFCTCAYGGVAARFVTISDDFTVRVYDVLNDMEEKSFKIDIRKRNIGEKLVQDTGVLNTYHQLSIESSVSEAKFSATIRGNYLLLGIHIDNNFSQWAVRYNLVDGSVFVLQGYGFVGPDGLMTGGEIPERYFSEAQGGFTASVQPLESLKNTEWEVSNLADIPNVNERIVGTENQQWYIIKNLHGIVSHVRMYDDGSFDHEVIPITNNYSAIYLTPSGNLSVLSDFIGNIRPLAYFLGDESGALRAAVEAVCVTMGYPIIYQYDPKSTSFIYLQQTIGQYAMVHYNNTNIIQQKDIYKESYVRNYADAESETVHDDVRPVDEDEISFDIQHISQKATAKSSLYEIPLLVMGLAVLSADLFTNEKLRVNETQNQTQTSDKGRKFTQSFLQAINNVASSDMTIKSHLPSVTSKVTAVKTLDMFYSTSDSQQISAGPGWVNHNFVSQTVAQSSTSLQLEVIQIMVSTIFKALTLAQIKLEVMLLEAAAKALHNLAEAIGGGNADINGMLTGETSGYIGTFGTGKLTAIAGQAVSIAGSALESAAKHLRSSMEDVESILDSMGAGTLHSSVSARLSKHAYDIEGKHRYGSKSETFMYPCFGCQSNTITDETTEASYQNKTWGSRIRLTSDSIPSTMANTSSAGSLSVSKIEDGMIDYYIAMCKGVHTMRNLPSGMAFVAGAESYLPPNNFKNENIGEGEPVFPTHPIQDYILDERWQLSQTATVGFTTWIGCKDTKIIDGEYSNIVVSDTFCGVASPYTAIEIKRGIDKKYLRPWAITPQALALNHTGLNCCYEEQAYHAFDGYGYRIVEWQGAPGMNKERQTWQYCFLINDRFKRSNKMPLNEFLGNFKSEPTVEINALGTDRIFNFVTRPGEGVGLNAGTVGEDKDVRRYAVPVFSDLVNTLPAAVKTISSYNLAVIDGITSLTTENRNLQSAYKAPVSVDFTIGKDLYRYTQEYICSVRNERGVNVFENLVPCLGLSFLGSTPHEAYFYSKATRQYYEYTGGSSITAVDMIERFRNVLNGRYDFINQEVLMPCLATFERIDSNVHDDEDETDNIIIPRLKDSRFTGEVPPPVKNIFNTRSWFRTLSIPAGVVYQGPNRCIINRFVYDSYMKKSIIANYGEWKRVPREEYHPFRKYKAEYETVDEQIGTELKIKGWTHNPFLLVTAPLGVNEETDCMFEWEITFCWPVEMDELYGKDDYAVVNIQAQCMTPGGKVVAARPVHVFLTKELFTRTGNYGYYSFRYQSKCGIGNRERLHIWSDQYIAVSALQVEIKSVSQKRTEILTQQLDVEALHEV